MILHLDRHCEQHLLVSKSREGANGGFQSKSGLQEHTDILKPHQEQQAHKVLDTPDLKRKVQLLPLDPIKGRAPNTIDRHRTALCARVKGPMRRELLIFPGSSVWPWPKC